MSPRILAVVAVLAAAVIGPVEVLRADSASVASPALAQLDAAPSGAPDGAPPDAASDVAPAEGVAGTAPSPEQLTVDGAASATNRFVPVTPTRVLDTRAGLGPWPYGLLPANGDIAVQIAGQAGVPANASAVVLNVTVTEPQAAGFVTAFPTGQPLPNASSVNVERGGQTVANLVTVPLGSGMVELYNQMPTHLVADVFGYYVPAASASTGRFTASTPTRVLDTRDGGMLQGGTAYPLNVAAAGGIPATATAAVLNLTATQPTAAGYVSLIPDPGQAGGVSNLNVDYAGQTIANQVIVPLVNGQVWIYPAITTHVVIDLDGWYTGSESSNSTNGLFVPVTPTRVLDTRDPGNAPMPWNSVKPGANASVDVSASAKIGASSYSALVMNATATETTAAGFFTLFGAGLGQPLASNLNANVPGQTVPNHAVVPTSTAGFTFFTSSGASLIADVSGYFTGTPPAPTAGYVPNGTSGPPSTGPHTFLYQQNAGDAPARWNPCAAIPYSVNLNGAPSFAMSEVEKAVAKVEAATGLDFQFMGTTNAGNDNQAPAGSKAVIAFVNSGENAGIGNVAGLGGGSYYPAWNGRAAYVARGYVLINETLNYTQGTSASGLEGLLLHEIGHMVGLNHVNTTQEVMYGTMHNLPYGGYGPGDREGLWYLGAAQGCIAGASSTWSSQSLGEGPAPITVQASRRAGGAAGAAEPADRPLLDAYCGIEGKGGGTATTHQAATQIPDELR